MLLSGNCSLRTKLAQRYHETLYNSSWQSAEGTGFLGTFIYSRVGEADLAGARHAGAAAHHAGHRDAVVGCSEGPGGGQRRVGVDKPGGREHLGHLERLVAVEL